MPDFETKLRRLSERGNPVGAEELIERIEAELAGDPLVVVSQRREGTIMTKTQPPPTTKRPSSSRGLAWAAAVFVAIVAGGALFFALVSDRGPVADTTPVPTVAPPSTTAAPTPTTVAPETEVTAAPRGLPVGSEFLLWSGHSDGWEIAVTIPSPGWGGESGYGILVKDDSPDAPDGAGLIAFPPTGIIGGRDLYVYGDPCQWDSTRPDAPVKTVDEAVSAFSGQLTRDASAPVDVTVAGFSGKSITLHVPDDAVFTNCNNGEFRSYVRGRDDARYAQDPGQIDKLWILDVNGDLLILNTAYYAGTPQEVVDEMDRMVESAVVTLPQG